jgi:GT2 family glycosyltransferase/glycosyltransferase involved in cell wall biosynthesis
MHVLLVVHGYPPNACGGTEIYTRDLALALRDIGVDVQVLAREADPARPDGAVRRDERDGVVVRLINNTYRDCRSVDDSYRLPAIRAAAARVVDELRPDIVHVQHLTGLSIDLLLDLAYRDLPVIFTLHDYWLLCHRGQLLDLDGQACAAPGPGCARCVGGAAVAARAAPLLRRLDPILPAAAARTLRSWSIALAAAPGLTAARDRRECMLRAARHVTRFHAPSRALRERFLAAGFPPERVTLVPLGVPSVPPAPPRDPSAPLRLGFLGSLMLSKAPHLALEAFASLPRGAATLDLYGEITAYHGDDSYRARLAPLLTIPGVRHHGAVTHERALRALATLDALIVPSIWPENSPCVIREAFAAGLPVVAASVGGVPELVEHERGGLLFQAGDSDDLRLALRRLLDEVGLYARLRASVPRVLTIADAAARLVEEYRSTLARPPHSASVPRLAAVVLNYRTPLDTLLAVRSLESSRRPVQEVIVVDNASPDGSAPLLRARLPRVEVIASPRNLGFSGGCNLGIARALARGAELVFLLNGDAVVAADTLGLLEEALGDQVGIAGPVVLARGDPSRVASAGMSFSPITGRMRHRLAGARFVREPSCIEVAGVSGCALLVHRRALGLVGPLDEDYFFSFEDLDLCLRARAAGERTVVVGDAVVYHQGSLSIGPRSPRRLYFAARNHLLLVHRRAPAHPLLAALRTAMIVALNTAHALRGTESPRLEGCRAVLEGVIDFLRRDTAAD